MLVHARSGLVLPLRLAEAGRRARTVGRDRRPLRETLYHEGEQSGLGVFATFLFTHNAQIALFAFALGFAFCACRAALLVLINGVMLGALFALFASRGLGFSSAAGFRSTA